MPVMATFVTWAAAMVWGAASLGAPASPEVPAQFTAWGSAGPEFAPLPAGWRQAPEPAGPPAAWSASDEQRKAGCVLLVRPAFSDEPIDSPGLSASPAKELRLVAARGEYEPGCFVVHALADLAAVRVEVGPLRAAPPADRLAAGSAIAAENVDVRVVRAVRLPDAAGGKTYRLEPFLLERRGAFDVPAGRGSAVWLTAQAPRDAAPGRYHAEVRVTPKGRPASSLTLTLDVLPFALPPAAIEVGAFYPRPPADEAMLRKQLIDMREHGCTSVEPALGVEIATRDRVFGPDDVKATVDRCRRLLRAQREVFGPWRHPVTFEAGHQIICHWDKDRNWFVYWPHEKKVDDELLRAVDVVRQVARAEGAAALRIYALDEAGAHNLLDEAAYYYAMLKKHRPDLATWTSIGGGMAMGSDEIGRLSGCVDFLSTNRFTPAIARQLVGRGRPFGVYNGAGHTAAGSRFFYGLWGFKTGAAAVAQWCYHFGNSAFGPGGLRQADEGYVYLADDGPLPSIPWEAAREGIDDFRYAQLLRQAIAAARASADPAVKKAGTDAEAALRDLLGRIGWGFQALASDSKTPPPPDATMRKWRAELTAQIVRLRAAGVDLDASAGKAPPRPGPMDLPWAEPPAAEVTYGPELLPGDDFQPGKTRWLVQAWKGKGKGGPDPAGRRGSDPAVRIDNPDGAGDDVTVLVWPSWGGGQKLDLQLDGRRTYELSCWCRWQGRTNPPGPRIALPQGAEKTVRSGRDEPDAAGWQRLWVRTEMNYPAVPKYLGVWVQGAGSVWASGLSLREVVPPAMTLQLDQTAYDALDAAGVAEVSVDRRLDPAAVRFTLRRAGGAGGVAADVVAARTAPFRATVPVAAPVAAGAASGASPAGAPEPAAVRFLAPADLRQCRIAFDPAALKPGRYEATVDLLDEAGHPLAAASRSFDRLPDER